MIRTWKNLAFLFALLALASLAHDLWRAYSIGNRFTLSQIGWFFQQYTPGAHDAVRGFVAGSGDNGRAIWNGFFVPVLSTYTLIWTLGPAALFAALWLRALRRARGPRRPPSFRQHRPNY